MPKLAELTDRIVALVAEETEMIYFDFGIISSIGIMSEKV